MEIPPPDLYQLTMSRFDELQSEANRVRAARESKGKPETSSFIKLQRVVEIIGMALLPLGESFRAPISEPRSLDISTH